MEEVKKAKKTVVGNKTTEIIIGTAATKLAQATKSINEALQAAAGITNLIDEGTLKVVNLQSEIEELKVTLAQEKKNAAIDLELAFKAKEDEMVNKYLATRNLAIVESSVLQKTISDYNTLKADFDKNVSSEVAKAIAIVRKDHQNDLTVLNLQHQNKEAANNAEITQLKAQNAFLAEQVASWKAALDAERLASVERSKASAVGTLNVGTNK
jgi:hypothetical protein